MIEIEQNIKYPEHPIANDVFTLLHNNNFIIIFYNETSTSINIFCKLASIDGIYKFHIDYKDGYNNIMGSVSYQIADIHMYIALTHLAELPIEYLKSIANIVMAHPTQDATILANALNEFKQRSGLEQAIK